jgi:NADH-quinone oxidoreductase subunit E
VGVCKRRIAKRPFELSADGKFSWEEVECLGACANAPMVQIGKDYYEDLTTESLEAILDAFARGEAPPPGSYKGRFASEPEGGATSLASFGQVHEANASVEIAATLKDTVKPIDGTEPLYAVGVLESVPERPEAVEVAVKDFDRIGQETERRAEEARAWPDTGSVVEDLDVEKTGDISATPDANTDLAPEAEPERMEAAPEGGGDDLKAIRGIGPKIEGLLHELGIYTFAQIAAWGPGEIAWIDSRLNFRGRVTRDDWTGQARALMAGDEPS